MRLINYHDTVTSEIRSSQKLPKQHAISHVLQYGWVRRAVLKSYGVANPLAKFDIHFLSHATWHTHRCHPPRLCATNLSMIAISGFTIGVLSGLSRTCFCLNDKNPMFLYSTKKFFSVELYWQCFSILLKILMCWLSSWLSAYLLCCCIFIKLNPQPW